MSSARDALRTELLKTRTPTREPVTFFGQKIEIKQPDLKAILDARNAEDRESAIINTLMLYAVVPGTDERIFEEADKDVLLGMPFGGDFVAVTQAMEKLTNVNFLEAKPPLEETPSSSSSTASPMS